MDPPQQPFNFNRQLKEEFVSNLTGSSMSETAALAVIVPVLLLLRQWTLGGIRVSRNGHLNSGYKCWRHLAATLGVDYISICLPTLLFFTVLAEWVFEFAIFLVLMLLLLISIQRSQAVDFYSKDGSQLRTNISSYRVSVMIMTCLCILAVDFKIYPRRYAKTETYGTSLMDIGSGSFVLANALVSKQARGIVLVSWKAAIQSLSPIILLAFGRLVCTTGVDYQVHVGEYGVHWNFFFTLAAVSLLAFIFNMHPNYCGILGSFILVGYQICLICGLNEYLLSDERTVSLISQNKEGIFSIFGYWGLYLVGVQLGNHLFFGNGSANKIRGMEWTRIKVFFLCALFWLLTVTLDKHVERVSRRMCNLAYVTLVLALNFQGLGVLMLSNLIPGAKMTTLEEAFDKNLFGSFLLANVLTGIINLYVDTLSTSSLLSLSILLGYSFVLSFLMGFAMFANIRLKFW